MSNGLSNIESTTLKVFSLLKENPYITKKEIIEKIGISMNAVQKHINKLKFSNIIKKGGPATRGGHWIILTDYKEK